MTSSLRLPGTVADAIAGGRHQAGMEREDLASRSGVPVDHLAILESGTTAQADPVAVLEELVRVTSCLDLPPRSLVGLTLASWSSAYADKLSGSALEATQPLVLPPMPVAQPFPAAATIEFPLVPAPPAVAAPPSPPESAAANVRHGGWRRRPWLLRGVVAVAVLNLVGAGLLVGLHSGLGAGAPTDAVRGLTRRPSVSSAPAVTQLISSTAARASYRVLAPRFRLTVTAERPSWVSLDSPGAPPGFAQVIDPGTRTFTESAPVELDIGAGGTTVVLTTGGGMVRLAPPAAPFAYEFSPT